ncbi:hypothetical protein M5E86_21085 [Blautia wexlerae]|nr:hypothetical protein M5E86_21085 [Blautia wexlerae]
MWLVRSLMMVVRLSKPVDVLPDRDSKNIMSCVKRIKNSRLVRASYGWLLASVKMSWYIKYCGWKKLTAPVLLFQAERDDFVSVNALRKFAEKINHRGITSCEYVYLPGTRHETYRSDDRTMEMYLDKIMKFMDSGMVSDSCT